MTPRFYFFPRAASGDNPAGTTVCKRPELPEGDFRVTEYTWHGPGFVSLWFVDTDRFTADERQAAYRQFVGV